MSQSLPKLHTALYRGVAISLEQLKSASHQWSASLLHYNIDFISLEPLLVRVRRVLCLTCWFQDISAFVGISGPFDLVDLSDHFHSRGLDRRLLSSIFEARSGAQQSNSDVRQELGSARLAGRVGWRTSPQLAKRLETWSCLRCCLEKSDAEIRSQEP